MVDWYVNWQSSNVTIQKFIPHKKKNVDSKAQ